MTLLTEVVKHNGDVNFSDFFLSNICLRVSLS